MSLIIKREDYFTKVLEKPLVCYKILRQDKTGKVLTPYIGSEFKIDQINIAQGEIKPMEEPGHKFIHIDSGVFHAYLLLACCERCFYLKQKGENLRFAKCIIPSGTTVYFGSDGELAASKMSFVEWC